MPDAFSLKNVRLSFPAVFQVAKFRGGPSTEAQGENQTAPKFEATLLLDKTEDANQIKLIKQHTKAALIEHFGSESKIPKAILLEKNYCLRDGDNVDYDGYAGHMSIKAANKVQPRLMDRDKSIVTSESSGLLYAGSFVDVVLKLWVQDNSYGKKVNCNLLALRHRTHGEPFGAGGVPDGVEDMFEDLDDEIDDLDSDDL